MSEEVNDQAVVGTEEVANDGAVKDVIVRSGDNKEIPLDDLKSGKYAIIENDAYTKQNQEKSALIKSLEEKAGYTDELLALVDKFPKFKENLNNYITKYQKGDFEDMENNNEEVVVPDEVNPLDEKFKALEEENKALKDTIGEIKGWKDSKEQKEREQKYYDTTKGKAEELGIPKELDDIYLASVSTRFSKVMKEVQARGEKFTVEMENKVFSDVAEMFKEKGLIKETKDKLSGGELPDVNDKEALKIKDGDDSDTILKKMKARFGR